MCRKYYCLLAKNYSSSVKIDETLILFFNLSISKNNNFDQVSKGGEAWNGENLFLQKILKIKQQN